MARFHMKMEEESCDFHLKIGEFIEQGTVDVDIYDGDYEVTPMIRSQTLETNGKLMEDNVLVLSIPYWETSNLSGGKTVYIGGE